MADYSGSGSAVNVTVNSSSNSGGDAAGDTLTGIEGVIGSNYADTLIGSGGDNSLFGGSGNDSLDGGAGQDSLSGGSGSDRLYGGTDNDTLDGGSGADSLFGGTGNDSLTGGTGSDTMSGGTGRDVYELTPSGGADRITDFGMSLIGDQTEDRLDVSDLTNGDGSPVKSFDVAITDDGSGNTLLTFPGGETLVLEGVSPATAAASGMLHKMGVPCFASGTCIMTPSGERPVEHLLPGDLVTLADGGSAPVLWHGRRVLTAAELNDLPDLRPIRLKAGSFGLTRDLIVSPQHGIRVQGDMVRARHLAALGRGAHVARGIRSVIYHHLLLPRHAMILAQGAACESFYPGPQAMTALALVERIALTKALGLDPATAFAPLRIIAAYGSRCLPVRPWREVSAPSGHAALTGI